MTRLRFTVALLALVFAAGGCGRYNPDPETKITSKTLRRSGEAEAVVKVLSREQIRSAFDYHVEDVPIVPVSVMIRNRGKVPLQLDYLRTRLVDGYLSYGLIPTEDAILRTQRTGFWKAQLWLRLGLLGYIYHRHQINETNERLRRDFEMKALPEKPLVPNATLYGVLFFQIDRASATHYDPSRYAVVLSFVSPGNPPVIEIRFDPEEERNGTPRG
jgi:hypothetical protein